MDTFFEDYKKITLGELNENTRQFIFDFLGQAMWEGFLYEYKGKLYKITDIEMPNDKQLEIELVEDDLNKIFEHTSKKRLSDVLDEIPHTNEPRFLRKGKSGDTIDIMDTIFN